MFVFGRRQLIVLKIIKHLNIYIMRLRLQARREENYSVNITHRKRRISTY